MHLDPSKKASFNCFSCTNGSAQELLQSIQMYNQINPSPYPIDFKVAQGILDAEDLEVIPLPAYSEFHPGTVTPFQAWPEYWISSFLSVSEMPEAYSYLQGRNVPEEMWAERELRYDFSKRMIVFPYRNINGELAGARGRAIDAGVLRNFHDYRWNGVNNAKSVWYNEQCLQTMKPVVVVEGQFDAMRVLERYDTVVAMLTAKPTPEKLLKLSYAPKIILIPDNDGPGGAGENTQEFFQEFCLPNKIPLEVCNLPMPTGADKIDPGDCHPDFLYELIQPFI
jgi:hypothetical protein